MVHNLCELTYTRRLASRETLHALIMMALTQRFLTLVYVCKLQRHNYRKLSLNQQKEQEEGGINIIKIQNSTHARNVHTYACHNNI